MEHSSSDPLSPEKMQLFIAGLSGLPKDEIRKAKILYIRNAIAEYKAARAGIEGFRGAQKGFSLFPFFRPVIGAQQKMIDAQLNLAREKIQNAIDVWKDDLAGETFNLDF